MVEAAQQDQVLRYCRAAVGPMHDVVGLGPLDGGSAAGPGAPARLLQLQLPPQGRVREPECPAEFDRFAGAVVEHVGDDQALTRQQPGLPERDRVAFQGGDSSGVFPGEGLDVDRQVQGGGVAVAFGRVRVGAIARDHLVERFGVAVRGRGQAPVAVDVVLAGRGDGGGEVFGEEFPGVGR
ncbi:hypothetical protein GCM10028833_09320 [Glycomyces tarimensis]